MEKIEKAMHAKTLLDNPLYKQAMLEIKGDLFDQWSRKTIWNGKRKREKIWDMMQGIIEFESKLNNALIDGKMLVHEEARKEKIKNIR